MPINHPLVRTLKSLRGNARGCVYTEPLWGIPHNLYAPYISVYMLALGLTDSQIGLIASIGLAFQVLWTLLSGAITDKLGRKRATLIFDLISWSIPCLIWALAQNFWYFLAGTLVNAVWRVTHNAWQCLLVEDTDPNLLVDIWSWIYIAGLVAAFASPLTGLLIARFSLVPTMRGLYLLAFVMMTAKFLATNAMVTETRQGRVRMHETRGEHLFSVLRGSGVVLRQLLRAPDTLATGGLLLIMGITLMVRTTFWSILVTEKLRIPAEHLALYSLGRSVTMLLFYFGVMPRLRAARTSRTLILSFGGLILSSVLLIAVPPGSYVLLLLATVIEAFSAPAVDTLLQKLVAVNVEPKERARIMALLYAAVLVLTSPFGWIAGRLSEINRSLPFVMSILLFVLGALLAATALRGSPEPEA